MNVLLGLGNPGPEYADTRHNVGWRVLDRIAAARFPGAGHAPEPRSVWDRLRQKLGRGNSSEGPWINGDGPYKELTIPSDHSVDAVTETPPFLLVKPLTYMNSSGEAACALSDTEGVLPGDMLVIVDDIHLALGDIRLRRGGSHGGHNGLRSLAECLGTTDQPRLRIGMGAPPDKDDLIDFVLSPFEGDEEPVIRAAIKQAALIAEAFGVGGFDSASAAFSSWKNGQNAS